MTDTRAMSGMPDTLGERGASMQRPVIGAAAPIPGSGKPVEPAEGGPGDVTCP